MPTGGAASSPSTSSSSRPPRDNRVRRRRSSTCPLSCERSRRPTSTSSTRCARPRTADAGHRTLLHGRPPHGRRAASTPLASHFTDRTVVTYDPRGIGRSVRKDGSDQRTPELHAADLHALIADAGRRARSTCSPAVAAPSTPSPSSRPTPTTSPPWSPTSRRCSPLLPDADHALAAERAVQAAYHERGFGAGMAAFIALTSWPGEFTDAYLAQPRARPGAVRHAHRRRRPPRRPAAVRHRQRDHRATGPTRRPCRRPPHAWSSAVGGRVRATCSPAGSPGASPRPWAGRVTEFPSHHGGLPRRRSSATRASRRPSPPACTRCSTTAP